MKTITSEKLREIISRHAMWLRGEAGGERADLRNMDFIHDDNLSGVNLSGADLRNTNFFWTDLSGADLRNADLYGAVLHDDNLSGVNLSGADLRNTNFFWTDLSGADLRNADLYVAVLHNVDLSGVNLSGADLRNANFFGATLSKTDLRNADLYGAVLHNVDLSGAKIDWPMQCPETGSFIAWKKCLLNIDLVCEVIVKLEIPEEALRSSATTKKCRASMAKVLSVEALYGGRCAPMAHSAYNPSFEYRVGKTVSVDDFDKDRWNECSTGIHFFMTREDAVNYIL